MIRPVSGAPARDGQDGEIGSGRGYAARQLGAVRPCPAVAVIPDGRRPIRDRGKVLRGTSCDPGSAPFGLRPR
jgi:hypothetical protein